MTCWGELKKHADFKDFNSNSRALSKFLDGILPALFKTVKKAIFYKVRTLEMFFDCTEFLVLSRLLVNLAKFKEI